MKNRRIVFLPLLAAFILSCQGNVGWVDLFNGENLDNWRLMDGTAEFKVENGIIVGVYKLDTPNTFLATDREYNDFILEYEMKGKR